MLLLLLGCSQGTIRYATGSDDIRTAYFATDSDPAWPNVEQAVVLLSNSDIDCDSIPSIDASVASLQDVSDLAAFTRENARVVVLYLYQVADMGWVGDYVLKADHSGETVTTDHGVAGAAYLGVNEAVLLDEDGLQRFYQPGSNPGDCTLVADVAEPGDVKITRDGKHLHGTFSLDSVDVSGRFTAEECTSNTNFVNTFQSIVLFQDDLSMCIDDTVTGAEDGGGS